MEHLTCQLSPATLAVLYEMLQDNQHADVMRMRANLLGEDVTVLAELKHLYEQWWSFCLKYTRKQPELLQSAGPAHGQLATWFLSVFRGPSLEFSGELRRRTQELFRAALPDDQRDIAAQMRPTIIGWSLGSVPGDYDYSLPVIFAEESSDANVRLAYSGLVEHLVMLGQESSPWSEVHATAVIWRGAGIAEGLLPKENLVATLQYLTAQAKPMIPDGLQRELTQHWDEFIRIRNGLTHVAAKAGEYSFSDLEGKVTNHDDLRLCLFGVTHFVAENIRSALSDPDHDNNRTRMLDAIRSELRYLAEMD